MRNLSIILPAVCLLVIGTIVYIVVIKITTPPTILVTAKPGSGVQQASSPAQATGSADIRTMVTAPTTDTVKQWQQEADSGKARWRLDPTSTAKEMSASYGFTTDDQFSSSSSDKSPNVTVIAQHAGKTYVFIMYQPGMSGSKGIWAVKSISGQ